MMDEQDRELWGRRRIVFIGSIFALLFIIVVGRTFHLQILQHEHLLKKADKQHQRIVPLNPARGIIMDRNGTPLAVSVEMDSCYAEPKHIVDKEGTAAVLSGMLKLSKDEILRKFNNSKNFTWVARRLTPEVAQPVKNMKLKGIGFAKENKRFYPNLEIASHIIGFTGHDPNGIEGIELKYDATILGSTGYLITERDNLGRDIGLKSSVIKQANAGKNLVLTIDKYVQFVTERELTKVVKENDAKSGIAIVMESDTGRIVSLANYPTYNPNNVADYSSFQLRNRSVADSFEPGSTFKTFVIAGALEERLVRPGDSFNCENGVYKIADRTIHDTHPFSSLTVSDIMKHSSNIGAAKIGMKMGNDRLFKYLKGFGFGVRTGIDLPGESPGNLRDNRKWYGVDLATISFGQGVSTSAIQLTAAMSAVVNGGNLMKPYIVERILDDNSQPVKNFEPTVVRKVISPETSQKMVKILETVTMAGGTATTAAVDGYRVGGKTGTAQKVDALTHRYGAKRTASFLGFAPVEKPKFTIMVVVDEPKKSQYGGVVAAPAFREIASNLLPYYKVAASGPKKEKQKTELASAANVKQMQAEEEDPDAGDGGSIDIEADVNGETMPNFRGMSMRKVLQVMEKKKLNIRLIGSGKAREQNPPAGRVIKGNDEVWIKFLPSA